LPISDCRLPIVLVILALAAVHARGGTLPLVKDGRPLGAIVLPREPSQGESFAAEELQRYVEKATGAKLAIVQEPADKPGVYIGATKLAASLGLPKGELKTDGFNAVASEGKLVVVGRNDLATRYGVYTLLHEAVGVRWFMPTELFEQVPKRRDVVARPSRWRTVPAFDPRTFYAVWSKQFSYTGARDPQFGCDLWATRNRLSVDKRGRPGDFSHNLYRIVVPSRYAKTYPEYFPIREDGRRYLPRDDRDQSWQPCFSQDGVVRLCVEAARKAFDADPNRLFFSLGINDGWGCCCCPACRKLDAPRRKFRRRVVHSGSYFTFVNRVAREVAKTHPGRRLGCIAYNETELPPSFPLEPNVWVWNTQDTSQHHDRRYRDGDREMLRGWREVSPNVCKYDYYGLTWVLPRYFPREIEADLRWCAKAGVRGHFVEDCPVWPTMGPMVYIAAQQHWDPSQDWRRLQRDFCRGLFGRSARAMERLLDTWERAWHTRREGRWFEGLGRVRQQVPLFPPKVVSRCDRMLEEAMAEADSDLVRRRIDFFRRGWAWSRLYAVEDHLRQRLTEPIRRERDADANADLPQARPRLALPPQLGAVARRLRHPAMACGVTRHPPGLGRQVAGAGNALAGHGAGRPRPRHGTPVREQGQAPESGGQRRLRARRAAARARGRP